MKKKERTFLIILTAVTAIISLLFYVNIFDLVIAAIISLIVFMLHKKRGSISIAILLAVVSFVLIPYTAVEIRTLLLGSKFEEAAYNAAYGVYPYRQIKVLSYNMISKKTSIVVIEGPEELLLFPGVVTVVHFHINDIPEKLRTEQLFHSMMGLCRKVLFPFYFIPL
ncbi:MAG: hypothetical protein ACOX8I_09805 [Bacillota bacterium]|jgi:hypothetical protein